MNCSPQTRLATLQTGSPVSLQGSPSQPEVAGGSRHPYWAISRPNPVLRSARGNTSPCHIPSFAESIPASNFDSSLVETLPNTTNYQSVESFYRPDSMDELQTTMSETLPNPGAEFDTDDVSGSCEPSLQHPLEEPFGSFQKSNSIEEELRQGIDDFPVICEDENGDGQYRLVGLRFPIFDGKGKVTGQRCISVDEAQPSIGEGNKKTYHLIPVLDEHTKHSSNPTAYLVPKVDSHQQLKGYVEHRIKYSNAKMKENHYGGRTANL